MSDLANIADPDQMLRHAMSGRTLYCSEMSLFCKIDKIMFADSENQDHKRYSILGKCKEYGPRADVALNVICKITFHCM